VIEALQGLWHGLLDALGQFIIPDWAALVGLLPVLLVLLVIGPLLSLMVLGWLYYTLRRPRTAVAYAEGPLIAPLLDGAPVYPSGEPYCPTDRLIYEFGRTTCERCGRDLTIRCPKCAAGRSALVEACGNCGLVLSMARRSVALRRAGPPPGGAAAA
jgi:hypothetical protein